MSLRRLNRQLHLWAGLLFAGPAILMIGSGIVLQVKKHCPWIQPPEQRGTGTSPEIELTAILSVLQSSPGLGVSGWDCISRMDIRPGRGLAKILLRDGKEVQIDLGTGRILQVAKRRSDLIEAIHDGSYFAGDWGKFGLFLPCGLALLLLLGTGLQLGRERLLRKLHTP